MSFHSLERPVAEADDVLVSEVGVGREPDLAWFEGGDLGGHGCIIWMHIFRDHRQPQSGVGGNQG